MRKYALIAMIWIFPPDGVGATAQETTSQPIVTEESAYFQKRRAATTTLELIDTIGLVRAIELRIDDQISDGCWTNTSAIKARLRAEFERFNVPVYDEELASYWLFDPLVTFSGLGYRLENGTCVATISLSVQRFGTQEYGSLDWMGRIFAVPGVVQSWSRRSILSGGGRGSNLNSQVMEAAQEFIDTLIADIARARRNADVQTMLEQWSRVPTTTRREQEALIERFTRE